MKLDELPLLNDAGGIACPCCNEPPSVAISLPVCKGCIIQILDGTRETTAVSQAFISSYKSGNHDDAEFKRQKQKIMNQIRGVHSEKQMEDARIDSF